MLNRGDRFCRPRCALSSASISGKIRKLKFGPFGLSRDEMMLRREDVAVPLGSRSPRYSDLSRRASRRDCSRKRSHGSCVFGRHYRGCAPAGSHGGHSGRRLVSVNSAAEISQTSREGHTRSLALSSLSNCSESGTANAHSGTRLPRGLTKLAEAQRTSQIFVS
jgi:hypothetical protein